MIKQIALLSNICFEPYLRAFIKERLSHRSYDTQFHSILYEGYQDNIEGLISSDLIVVCLNFEMFYTDLSNQMSSQKVTREAIKDDCIDKCRKLYLHIKNRSKSPIIWLGFEDYYCVQNNNYGTLLPFEGIVDKVNLTLNDMLKEDAFIDFKRLIASVGIRNAYDTKGKYRWNAPYSKELICHMADEIHKQYLIITGNTKKCLVLDCDNVLWGGILSEEGMSGIQIGESGLGRSFQDFQRYLLDLYYHGVILAISSKNDESDVLRVFREHTGMVLKEEHIACFRCNWDNKTDNIRNISDSLNIGLDSIVFVDDSVFEVESAKEILPEVTAVLYKRDTIYDALSCFNLKRDVDIQVVRERTNTYKTNTLRYELHKSSSSFEDYVSSLEMVVDIHETKNYELARISDLTQRTNKCTNGRRYTLENLKEKIELHNYKLYTICLSDKFSNLGIVGVIGLEDDTIDLFSLSCRALGRNVENIIIEFLKEKGLRNFYYDLTAYNNELYLRLKNCFELERTS